VVVEWYYGQAGFKVKILQEEEGKDPGRGIENPLQEGEAFPRAMRELQEAPAWSPQAKGDSFRLPFKKPEEA
jgi:hypothetical protein